MFVPERNLKELILSYLKREETSISGLARRLEDDGYKLHRLLVTGYLRALSDLGYVREREIPPAKVYGLAGGRERNLYEMLGAIARDLESDEPKAARLVIALLQRLFRRPIFLREVREAGFPSGYDALMVEEDERAEARKELMKVGIRLPLSEPAYQVKVRRDGKQEEALIRLILERFGVSGLVMETKQTRLERKGSGRT
ncbi:MAG: hypothetical protein ACE5LS_03970 [Thermoplasmata archaeon]